MQMFSSTTEHSVIYFNSRTPDAKQITHFIGFWIVRTNWCTSLPSRQQDSLKSFCLFLFLSLDLFGLQSVMMDGATNYGVLWASAALKCMGMWLKRRDEWIRQRDKMEGALEIYQKKARAR